MLVILMGGLGSVSFRSLKLVSRRKVARSSAVTRLAAISTVLVLLFLCGKKKVRIRTHHF